MESESKITWEGRKKSPLLFLADAFPNQIAFSVKVISTYESLHHCPNIKGLKLRFL